MNRLAAVLILLLTVATASARDPSEIRTAIEQARVNGGTVKLSGTYDLGSDGLVLTGIHDTVFDGPATLLFRSKPGEVTDIIKSAHSNNLTFRDIHFVDLNPQNLSNASSGAFAVTVWSSGKPSEGITLDSCSGTGLLGLLKTRGAEPIRGVVVRDCTVTNSYYACTFQGNGHDVLVSNLICRNTVRPMFANDVSNHNWDGITIDNDGKVIQQEMACVVASINPVASSVTGGFRIRAIVTGTPNNMRRVVGVEFQDTPTTTAVGRISDVNVDVTWLCKQGDIAAVGYSVRRLIEGKYVYQRKTKHLFERMSLSTAGPPVIDYTTLESRPVVKLR